MARRKATLKPGFQPGLTVVRLKESRQFITHDAGADFISSERELEMRGAFVRLRPPPGTPDGMVEEVKRQCSRAGALAVVVVRAAKEQPLVADAKRPSVARESLREAALAVMRGLASRDPAMLEKQVERTLAEAGL